MSSATVNYPYEIPNVVSITGDEPDNYYYFYNWGIEYISSCKSEKQTVKAIINNIPTANFNYNQHNNTVEFINNTDSATSYIWNFNDNNTSTEKNPTHIYLDTGNYIVNLTASNICGSNIYIDTVHISIVNIENKILNNTIKIYPNPITNSYLNIESDNNIISISIIGIDGKTIINAKNTNIINVSDLNTGTYLIYIKTEKNNVIKTVIVN